VTSLYGSSCRCQKRVYVFSLAMFLTFLFFNVFIMKIVSSVFMIICTVCYFATLFTIDGQCHVGNHNRKSTDRVAVCIKLGLRFHHVLKRTFLFLSTILTFLLLFSPTFVLHLCFSVAKHDVRSLNFAVTRFLIKLFRSTNIHLVDKCRLFFNLMLPSEKQTGEKRRITFENKVSNCNSLLYYFSIRQKLC